MMLYVYVHRPTPEAPTISMGNINRPVRDFVPCVALVETRNTRIWLVEKFVQGLHGQLLSFAGGPQCHIGSWMLAEYPSKIVCFMKYPRLLLSYLSSVLCGRHQQWQLLQKNFEPMRTCFGRRTTFGQQPNPKNNVSTLNEAPA